MPPSPVTVLYGSNAFKPGRLTEEPPSSRDSGGFRQEGFHEHLNFIHSLVEEFAFQRELDMTPVNVVAFIGEPAGSLIDTLIQANVFEESLPREPFFLTKGRQTERPDHTNSCDIEMHHDVASKTIYLQLKTPYQEPEVAKSIGLLNSFSQPTAYQAWIEDKEAHMLRALLYVFLVSHSVVVVSPTMAIDTSFLRTLQFLQTSKKEITFHLDSYIGSSYNYLNNQVNITRISNDFRRYSTLYPGRCVPDLHFLFQNVEIRFPSQSIHNETPDDPYLHKDSKLYKKLKQTLEHQLAELVDASVDYPDKDITYLFRLGSVFLLGASPAAAQDLQQSFFGTSPVPTATPATFKDGLDDLREVLVKKSWTQEANLEHIPAYPTGRHWAYTALLMQELFACQQIYQRQDASKVVMLCRLRGTMFDSERFLSNSSCKAALQMAEDAYRSDLPPLYTRSHHEMKLSHATKVFRANAIGSRVEKDCKTLAGTCDAIWLERGKCEVESLTGHQCGLKIHTSALVILHASSYTALHTCNCGHIQKQRDDPFTEIAANESFYSQFLCDQSPEVTSLSQNRASRGGGVSWSLLRLGPRSAFTNRMQLENQAGFLPEAGNLFQWYVPVDIRPQDRRGQHLDGPFEADEEEGLSLDLDTIQKQRQGLLPSKLPMGRIYRVSDESRFEKRSRQVQYVAQQQAELRRKYLLATAFLGVEYECPKGHRFFVTGKQKGSSDSRHQDHSSFLSHDLPIIMPCPCNQTSAQSNPTKAQLMRIFVVTPNLEASLVLNPIIREAAVAEGGDVTTKTVFTTESPGGVVLPRNSLVVFRLPYVYSKDGEAFHPTLRPLVLMKHYVYFIPPLHQ